MTGTFLSNAARFNDRICPAALTAAFKAFARNPIALAVG